MAQASLNARHAADQPDFESGLASYSKTDRRLRQPCTNTPHTCTIDANVTLTGVVPRDVAVVMAPRSDRRGTAFRPGTTWCTGVDSMTRSGRADEGDQTGGQGGLDARLDAVLSVAPAGVFEWRVLGRGAEAPPLGATRSAEARTDCLSTVDAAGRPLGSWRATGWPLQSSSGRWVWLAAGEGSADTRAEANATPW